MVSLLASSLTSCSSPDLNITPSSLLRTPVSRKHRPASVVVAAATSQKPTKFVTFLGKGGSGKTTASVFASQYRGGSELLIEAGDQRRVIRLPSQIQGKVGGAKFVDRSLIITMR